MRRSGVDDFGRAVQRAVGPPFPGASGVASLYAISFGRDHGVGAKAVEPTHLHSGLRQVAFGAELKSRLPQSRHTIYQQDKCMAEADAIDAETRITSDDHEALRLWLRLYACTNLIESRIRRRLQARFATTLPRFDLMAQLYRVPRGLRMSELSERLMVTGGNVTGLVDSLEKDGLVVREADEADRRALRVKLTREGRSTFRSMAGEHERWIVEMFAGLSQREERTLAAQLKTLKDYILRKVPDHS